MDFNHLVGTYGPWAGLIVFLCWLVWSFYTGKVYVNRIAADKEEREYKRQSEDKERQDRQADLERWATVVGNNTEAMTRVTDVVTQLDKTVATLSRDVALLYLVLKIDKEKLIEEQKEEKSG